MSSNEGQFGSNSTVTTPLWSHGSSSSARVVRYCEESTANERETMLPSTSGNQEKTEKKGLPIAALSLIGFWILGLCNNYGYVVMLTAAHDILSNDTDTPPSNESATVDPENHRECNQLSTGAILLADIVPSLVIKLISPWFPLKIHFRMVLILLLASAGFIMVAEATNHWLAICGVVFTALSSGLGEASLLSYMSFYKSKNVISAWSSGTGGAGLFGSMTYTVLTNFFHMSRYSTLYSLLVVPAVMGLTFWFILGKPDSQYSSQQSIEDPNSRPPTTRSQGEDINNDGDEAPLTVSNESFWEKVSSLPMLWKFMIPMGLVYLFEYTINQGLFELVQFPNIFLTYHEQYKWYQVTYQIGVFISRSSVNLFTIRRTWILAVLQGINVILFTTEAIYSYLPSIWIIFVAVLWEGLLGGAAYVNTYSRIAEEVPKEKQEFAMGFTSLSDAIGISLAGFISIPLHNTICSMA